METRIKFEGRLKDAAGRSVRFVVFLALEHGAGRWHGQTQTPSGKWHPLAGGDVAGECEDEMRDVAMRDLQASFKLLPLEPADGIRPTKDLASAVNRPH